MQTVNIHDAKTHLSHLVEKASKGESFIIARAGKPMVMVVPLQANVEPPKKRRIGFMKGMFKTPADFDTMMADEIEEMFYGNPDKFKDR